MSMHFRDLADQAGADGAITPEEILELRREGWSDGRMDPEEAEALFVLNDQLRDAPAGWSDFFVEALSEFLLNCQDPEGYVDEAKADWLIERIDHDGRVGSMTELALLERVFEHAVSVADSLKRYALSQIETAVRTGTGPTRDGGDLDPGGITEAEVRLLRRFVFAAGGDRPAAVSRAEAEALFRIKDATLGNANAPGWQSLFVQGVGNYLRGFGGAEPLPLARARELEHFMSANAVSIGGFLGRMLRASPADGVDFMLAGDGAGRDRMAEAAADDAVTPGEQMWLQGKLDADNQLDDLEKALVAFLAEE